MLEYFTSKKNAIISYFLTIIASTFFATIAIYFSPKLYTSVLYIQPAVITIGLSGSAKDVEPIAKLVEMLKLPTFYLQYPELKEACKIDDGQDYGDVIVANSTHSLVKNNNLIRVSYNAIAPEIATSCVSQIFESIKNHQSKFLSPYLGNVKLQITNLERRQNKIKNKLDSISKDDRLYTDLLFDAKVNESLRIADEILERSLLISPPMLQETSILANPTTGNTPTKPSKLFYYAVFAFIFVMIKVIYHLAAKYLRTTK